MDLQNGMAPLITRTKPLCKFPKPSTLNRRTAAGLTEGGSYNTWQPRHRRADLEDAEALLAEALRCCPGIRRGGAPQGRRRRGRTARERPMRRGGTSTSDPTVPARELPWHRTLPRRWELLVSCLGDLDDSMATYSLWMMQMHL